MTVRIRYMGNKHALASGVATLTSELPKDAPLFDLFCGMCSIGEAVAKTGRPVWSNDVQAYAQLVASCHTASSDMPLGTRALAGKLAAGYSKNSRALKERFEDELAIEDQVLDTPTLTAYGAAYDEWAHAGNSEEIAAEVEVLAKSPTEAPYRLCTLTFAWGYFGLRQAIGLDSIRFALDDALSNGDISEDEHSWALLAMLQAASTCASSPGHFAQYLSGSTKAGLARIVRQRLREPWDIFLDAAEELRPFGGAEWREGNRCFLGDAGEVWDQVDKTELKNAIVYADPPYSRDQYSRYYHVLESLVLYDYPSSSGAGRYRPDRFQTPFSLKTMIAEAFETLFASIAERDYTLILSYPENGLYEKSDPRVSLEELLGEHFSSVKLAMLRDQSHSTLGARHGKSHIGAREHVWVAA